MTQLHTGTIPPEMTPEQRKEAEAAARQAEEARYLKWARGDARKALGDALKQLQLARRPESLLEELGATIERLGIEVDQAWRTARYLAGEVNQLEAKRAKDGERIAQLEAVVSEEQETHRHAEVEYLTRATQAEAALDAARAELSVFDHPGPRPVVDLVLALRAERDGWMAQVKDLQAKRAKDGERIAELEAQTTWSRLEWIVARAAVDAWRDRRGGVAPGDVVNIRLEGLGEVIGRLGLTGDLKEGPVLKMGTPTEADRVRFLEEVKECPQAAPVASTDDLAQKVVDAHQRRAQALGEALEATVEALGELLEASPMPTIGGSRLEAAVRNGLERYRVARGVAREWRKGAEVAAAIDQVRRAPPLAPDQAWRPSFLDLPEGTRAQGLDVIDLARLKVGEPFTPGEVLQQPGGTFTPAPGFQGATFHKPVLVEGSRLEATAADLDTARRLLLEVVQAWCDQPAERGLEAMVKKVAEVQAWLGGLR